MDTVPVIQITAIQSLLGITTFIFVTGIAWGSLKSSVTHMGEDIKDIKADISTLKTDVSTLKSDITALKVHTGYHHQFHFK
jgi:hypothetical protein